MIPLLILVPLILLAALGAVWKARPVHAALFLALSLALNGVLYLVVGAHFIGLVQFMVYVGAVAILIVFSLLITRPSDEVEEKLRRRISFGAGFCCALPVLGVLGDMVLHCSEKQAPVTESVPVLSLEKLGTELFTNYAPAVLAVAVLLTAVMIGAALFAREPGKEPGKTSLSRNGQNGQPACDSLKPSSLDA